MVYRERDLVIRTIRDHFTPDIAEVWIDNPDTHQHALLLRQATGRGRGILGRCEELTIETAHRMEKGTRRPADDSRNRG